MDFFWKTLLIKSFFGLTISWSNWTEIKQSQGNLFSQTFKNEENKVHILTIKPKNISQNGKREVFSSMYGTAVSLMRRT